LEVLTQFIPYLLTHILGSCWRQRPNLLLQLMQLNQQ